MIAGTYQTLIDSWFQRKGMARWENHNGATVVWVHHSADPKKDNAWADDFARTFPGGRVGGAWRSEMDGEFDAHAGGRVFPEFTIDRHVIPPFPLSPEWPKWRVIDPGLNHNLACLFFTLDPWKQTVIVFDEHVLSGCSDINKHAQIIKGKTGKHEIQYTLIDPSAFAKTLQGGGRSVADLFAAAGIPVSPAYRAAKKRDQIPALEELVRVRDDGEPRLKVFNTCERTIYEFQKYRWKTKKHDEQQEPDEPVKVDDDAVDCCVPGDTQILTAAGSRAIMDLRAGDAVWTRAGMCSVAASRMTRENAELWSVEAERGYRVLATREHRVWTETRGWVRLDELTDSDTLLTCEKSATSIASSSTGSGTGSTRAGSTTFLQSKQRREELPNYTAMSGVPLTALSQQGCAYTISTATPEITTSATLPSCRVARTRNTTRMGGHLSDLSGSVGILTECATSPRSGTQARKGTAGTRRTAGVSGGTSRNLSAAAASAVYGSSRGFKVRSSGARQTARRSTDETPGLTTPSDAASSAPRSSSETATPEPALVLTPVRVLSPPQRTGRNVSVYNIEVEGCPEYFANGVLLHNCLYFAAAVDPVRKSQILTERDPLKPWYDGADRRMQRADMNRMRQSMREATTDWSNVEP